MRWLGAPCIAPAVVKIASDMRVDFEHTGVGFYVLSGQADYARRALLEAGVRTGIEEDPG